MHNRKRSVKNDGRYFALSIKHVFLRVTPVSSVSPQGQKSTRNTSRKIYFSMNETNKEG